MILAPPAGDAFSFITDLQIYPSSVFNLLMAIGIYLLRYHRSKLGLPRRFTYWRAGPLRDALEAAGFEVLSVEQSRGAVEDWLQVLALRPSGS